MSQESTLSRAESYASQVQIFGRLMNNEELLQPLEAVDLGAVKDVARSHLGLNDLCPDQRRNTQPKIRDV